MARADDDDDAGLPPIGDGTIESLADAKKGKPRNFLLITKGNKVKYLKVKKKPIKKGEIAEAKKLGYKGDACIGVITGSGMHLVFNLAISDGYESEPCKGKSLKDFLEEHADFKSQPTFAIVATPPEVPFEEEDLAHPLVARFLKLAGIVPAVIQKIPTSEGELRSTSSQIRTLLQDGGYAVAEPQINTWESRIKELLKQSSSNAPSSPITESTTPLTPSSPDQSGLKEKLLEALNKLVPQIKQAVANFPDRKVELLTPIAAVKKQIESGELQQAKQGLLAVGQLLKSLGTNSPSQTSPQNVSSDFQSFWEKAKVSWDDAMMAVNAQLEKLRVALVNVVDLDFQMDLKEIAEFGLNAMTSDQRVPLQACILDMDRAVASDKPKVAATLKTLVTQFMEHIDNDERIEACDDNPFQVQVSIRATLMPALQELQQAASQT